MVCDGALPQWMDLAKTYRVPVVLMPNQSLADVQALEAAVQLAKDRLPT